MKFAVCIVAFVALLGAVSAQRCPRYDVQVVDGTARNARGLKSTVDRYIRLLGGRDNMNLPGPLRNGQRSIDWDAPAVPFDMPGDFFKNTVTRGIEFSTRGNEFRVSNPTPPPRDDRFSSINNRVSRDFRRFSRERLFTSLRSNIITSRFSIPGDSRNRRALVSGFGAVFTDVDLRRRTFIDYFDNRGCLIFKLFIKRRSRGLSFGGIKVLRRNGNRVGSVIDRVVLNLGNRIITDRDGDGGRGDIVVLDDLLYGEPQLRRNN